MEMKFDLESECKKAAKILRQFIIPDPSQASKQDSLDAALIPPDILVQAKGIAILQVIKAGFIWSGRAGSGIVIAKLPQSMGGGWSAPSALGTAGVGVGGQIGAEITDFVIVLNSDDAVRGFSSGAGVTLGGSLSVAAGPIGRTAEASGSFSKRTAAAIFSYSKSKGLFAGVSLEGSAIVERKDANAKFYRIPGITAAQILTGSGGLQRPAVASELYRILDERCGQSQSYSAQMSGQFQYSPQSSSPQQQQPYPDISTAYGQAPVPPPYQPMQKTAVALFDFTAERSTDLSFKRGDMIQVHQHSDNQNDWWFGSLASTGQQGQFPGNYVRLQ